MKITLIWPRGMKQADWAVFPLGLGYLKNCVECTILDCALEPLTDRQIIEAVAHEDIVGVSVWGFNIENARKTIELIKAHSNAVVVSGGPSAHLCPMADYVILGEGEIRFKSIIDSLSPEKKGLLESKSGKLEGPHGAAREHNPKDAFDFPCTFHHNLDDFGLIDYDKLKLNQYIASGFKDWMYSLKDKFRAAPIMATRGCPYHCAYCQGPLIMGRKVRKHSIEYVTSTIEKLYLNHAIRQISFLDDNLTFDTQWAKKLCEAIISMKLKKGYRFNITTLNGVRVNRLDEELVILMKRAGWSEIVIAPESGSPDTLRRMGKTIDLADVERKVDLIHKHNMNVAAYFMAGYPGDTVKDLDLSRNYILNSGIDRAILNFFNPTPGTPIYEELLKQGKIDETCNLIDYKSIGYVTEELTRDDLLKFRQALVDKTRFKEKWIKDLY